MLGPDPLIVISQCIVWPHGPANSSLTQTHQPGTFVSIHGPPPIKLQSQLSLATPPGMFQRKLLGESGHRMHGPGGSLVVDDELVLDLVPVLEPDPDPDPDPELVPELLPEPELLPLPQSAGSSEQATPTT